MSSQEIAVAVDVSNDANAIEKKFAGNLFYGDTIEVIRAMQTPMSDVSDRKMRNEDLVAWAYTREYDDDFLTRQGDSENEETLVVQTWEDCVRRVIDIAKTEWGKIDKSVGCHDTDAEIDEVERRCKKGDAPGSWGSYLDRLLRIRRCPQIAVPDNDYGLATFLRTVGIEGYWDIYGNTPFLRYTVQVEGKPHLDTRRYRKHGKRLTVGEDPQTIEETQYKPGRFAGLASVDDHCGWFLPNDKDIDALHYWYRRDTIHNSGGKWDKNKISRRRFEEMFPAYAQTRPENPPEVFFDRLEEWDREVRVGSLALLEALYGYKLDKDDDPLIGDLAFEAIKATLIGCLLRVETPGFPHDLVLSLSGTQGCGKSSFVKELLPPYLRERYITDAMTWSKFQMDGDYNPLIDILPGKMFAEIPEGVGNRKDVAEAAKAGITRTTDVGRHKFGKATASYPRTAILVGTTNPEDAAIPADMQETRRFVQVVFPPIHPTEVKKAFRYREDWWTKNRNQVWAEVKHYRKLGHPNTIPDKLMDVAQQYNNAVGRGNEWEGINEFIEALLFEVNRRHSELNEGGTVPVRMIDQVVNEMFKDYPHFGRMDDKRFKYAYRSRMEAKYGIFHKARAGRYKIPSGALAKAASDAKLKTNVTRE